LADVFISYSRLDHERVKPIADRLVSLGYTVWWDKHERAGHVFADEVERELDGAHAVLTAWSHNARDSTWVYAESSRALDAKKFVQMKLDNIQLPLPFDAVHVADMSGGKSEWGPLEDALTRIVRNRAQPEAKGPLPGIGPMTTPAPAGSPKLLMTALCATLAAYAGAVSAAFNGMMSPEQLQIALVGMIGVAGACGALSAHRLLTISRAGG
jgi:hypothetical protein